MARRDLCLVLFACAALADVTLPASAAAQPHDRPKIAIVDFDATPAGWTLPPPRVGAVVAELMLNRLVGASQFHVLDGQWLRPDTPTGDERASQKLVLANAREAGVDYLLLGSITQLSTENRQRALGGGGIVRRLPVLGGFRRQTSELAISILVRVVDVRSGEIVTTASGNGTGARATVSGGALLSRLPVAGLLSSGSSNSRDAQLDQAIRRAVDAASVGLLNAAPRLTASN